MKKILTSLVVSFFCVQISAQNSEKKVGDYAIVEYYDGGNKGDIYIYFSQDSVMDYMKEKHEKSFRSDLLPLHFMEVIAFMNEKGYDLISLTRGKGLVANANYNTPVADLVFRKKAMVK